MLAACSDCRVRVTAGNPALGSHPDPVAAPTRTSTSSGAATKTAADPINSRGRPQTAASARAQAEPLRVCPRRFRLHREPRRVGYRRGRDGGSRKRARCGIAVPDVVDRPGCRPRPRALPSGGGRTRTSPCIWTRRSVAASRPAAPEMASRTTGIGLRSPRS
jgi:hypothetical protein